MKTLTIILLFAATCYLNGASWTPCNNGITDTDIECATADNNKIIIGTKDKGLFLSTDGGDFWTAFNNGFNPYPSMALALCISDGAAFAGMEESLYSLSESGELWTMVNQNELQPRYSSTRRLAVYQDKIVYSEDDAIFKSENYGKDWDLIASGHLYSTVNSLSVVDNRIFAEISGIIRYSADNGATWDSIYDTEQWGKTMAVKNDRLYFGALGGLFIFNIKDNQFELVKLSLPDKEVNAIVFAGDKVFAGTDKGVFVSFEGAESWLELNEGIEKMSVTCLALSGDYLFAGTYTGGLFKLDINSQDVKETAPQNTFSISPNPVSDILTINFNDNYIRPAAPVKIEIYNCLGVKILEEEFSDRIDISALSPGWYFLKAGSEVKYFIKN